MKTMTTNWKQAGKVLVWAGSLLAIGSLFAGFVTNNWTGLLVGLLAAGLVFTLLGLQLQGRQVSWRSIWARGSVQAGANALTATLAVLVILGMVNFLGVRYSTRLDLTENQVFTLAPQTQQLLQNLEEPVKVWVFAERPDDQVRRLLEDYSRRSQGNLTFEFVDPQLRPGLARDFGVREFGEVYLKRGERQQFVQSVQQEPLTEAKLTAAIEQIRSDRLAKAYFLQGHGEPPLDRLSQATQALNNKNITSAPLNLAERAATGESAQPQVPEDATLVVVVGPKRALFDAEVQALETYLNRGGSLLLLLDPNTQPGVDPLLQEWGVQMDERLVIDAAGGGLGIDATGSLVGFGPTAPLVTTYGEHPITEDFGNGNSFYPLARPLELMDVAGINQTQLLLTNDQSWAESDLSGEQVQFNPEADLQGPLTLGVALQKQPPDSEAATADSQAESQPSNDTPEEQPDGDPQETPAATPEPTPTEEDTAAPQPRMVVVGNSNFITDGLFNQQLNGDVFLNSAVWLSRQDDQPLSIRPKEVTNRRIVMSPTQGRLIDLVAVIILPLLSLVASVGLWWQRR